MLVPRAREKYHELQDFSEFRGQHRKAAAEDTDRED
jgi:hypothetical protein